MGFNDLLASASPGFQSGKPTMRWLGEAATHSLEPRGEEISALEKYLGKITLKLSL
jgi:hypothetical protein